MKLLNYGILDQLPPILLAWQKKREKCTFSNNDVYINVVSVTKGGGDSYQHYKQFQH